MSADYIKRIQKENLFCGKFYFLVYIPGLKLDVLDLMIQLFDR